MPRDVLKMTYSREAPRNDFLEPIRGGKGEGQERNEPGEDRISSSQGDAVPRGRGDNTSRAKKYFKGMTRSCRDPSLATQEQKLVKNQTHESSLQKIRYVE